MAVSANDNTRAALVDKLQSLHADYFALYIKTKNFHWHGAGSKFHDFQLLFDTQAAEIFALTDLIAERVCKNGGLTLASSGSIAGKSRITDQDKISLDTMAKARELCDDIAALVTALRKTRALAATAADNAIEGVIDDWTDRAQQRVRFLTQIIN